MTAATPGQPRDRHAEQDHAEFARWYEAQGYGKPDEEFGAGEMADVFTAGMQAQRDLDAAQHPKPVSTGQQLAYDEDREAEEIAREDDDGERDTARRMDALDEAARLEAGL